MKSLKKIKEQTNEWRVGKIEKKIPSATFKRIQYSNI